MHNHCVEYNGATERKRSNLVHKVFSLLQGGGGGGVWKMRTLIFFH